MTAFQDAYPHVSLLPVVKPGRISHRGGTVTGGWPTMSNPGVHVRARPSLWPYLAVVLLPLVGAVLILAAFGMFGQSSTTATVPVPQVSVSTSSCTFPDGS